jgi:DNA (cytosine-5)-methyltransferase 1
MPTPVVSDQNDRQRSEKWKGNDLVSTVKAELLPTTRAQNGEDRNNKIYARDPSQPQNLENALAVTLLPTPNTMEHLPAREGDARERQLRRGGHGSVRKASGNLREDILYVIPTPTARDYKDGSSEHKRDGVVQTDSVARAVFNSGEVQGTNWGKFEPAIRRWERTLGRLAPSPTKPDGKDGNHRLSSKFTEWMMGLPAGWVTNAGLTRNDELKACGNGVVPQQAELALRALLGSVATEKVSPE